MVDLAYLEATRENLRKQEAEAFANLERIRGAILLTDALLVEARKTPANEAAG